MMRCAAQLNRLMCLCPWFMLDFPNSHRLQQGPPAATSAAVWQVTCSHAMQPDGCAVGHCGIVLNIALLQFKMYQALSAVSWLNLLQVDRCFSILQHSDGEVWWFVVVIVFECIWCISWKSSWHILISWLLSLAEYVTGRWSFREGRWSLRQHSPFRS